MTIYNKYISIYYLDIFFKKGCHRKNVELGASVKLLIVCALLSHAIVKIFFLGEAVIFNSSFPTLKHLYISMSFFFVGGG